MKKASDAFFGCQGNRKKHFLKLHDMPLIVLHPPTRLIFFHVFANCNFAIHMSLTLKLLKNTSISQIKKIGQCNFNFLKIYNLGLFCHRFFVQNKVSTAIVMASFACIFSMKLDYGLQKCAYF